MKTKFNNKNGTLTVYAFACGYIEQKETNKVQTTLWLEHGVWNVRTHDFNTHTRVKWDQFTYKQLTKARKAFKQHRSDHANIS